MPKGNPVDMPWPRGGVVRSRSLRRQDPTTTEDAVNVRPRDVFNSRDRGGSRPGLTHQFGTVASGEVYTNPIQMIGAVNYVRNGNDDYFKDTFPGGELAGNWSQAPWIDSGADNIVASLGIASLSHDASDGGVVLDAISGMNFGEPYLLELLVVPYRGEHGGKYRLFFGLNNTSPDLPSNGVVVEVIVSPGGLTTGTVVTYDGSTDTQTITIVTDGPFDRPAWLIADVNDDDVTVYWDGLFQGAFVIPSGTPDTDHRKFGWGMSLLSDGSGHPQVARFRCQYKASSERLVIGPELVLAATGVLMKESRIGEILPAVTQAGDPGEYVTLNEVEQLQCVDFLGKLYIADHGNEYAGTDGTLAGNILTAAGVADWEIAVPDLTIYDYMVEITDVDDVEANGTRRSFGTWKITSIDEDELTLDMYGDITFSGTCSYRVARSVKVYDPVAHTMKQLVAATEDRDELDENEEIVTNTRYRGFVPLGCPIIFVHNGRLGLAGPDNAPGAYFLGRQDCDCDWNFTVDERDMQRAVAGGLGFTAIAEPITACKSTAESRLIIACQRSIWVLDGDPTLGSGPRMLTDRHGVVSRTALDRGPSGEMLFVDPLAGLCAITGGDASPVSDTRIPDELKNLGQGHIVSLAYDHIDQGLHIFVSPRGGGSAFHWWYDWESKSFWIVRFLEDHDPLAAYDFLSRDGEESGVIMGCRDGRVRRHLRIYAHNDDGVSFDSYCVFGPYSVGGEANYADGMLIELVGELSRDSGTVTPTLKIGETADNLETFEYNMSWVAGLNYTYRPRVRCSSFSVTLSGGYLPWAIERITGTVGQTAQQRKR